MAFDVVPVSEGRPPRLSILLWGEAGCGKTVLASTAPGKKLWLLFDPDGDASIKTLPDVVKIDLTLVDRSICNEFKKPDPFGIKQLIEDHNIDTIVVDSITKCSELGLKYVIPQTYKATDLNPTPAGYGARNLLITEFISTMLKITRLLDKHIIFITHEGSGEKNEDGVLLSVNMLLGGQLPNLLSKEISEVWCMADVNNTRRIAVRPERLRRPMKTRMFDISGKETGFEWKYNPRTKSGDTITSWWDKWKGNNYESIPFPK